MKTVKITVAYLSFFSALIGWLIAIDASQRKMAESALCGAFVGSILTCFGAFLLWHARTD